MLFRSNGTAVLTYTVSDGHTNDGASVTVTVKPVNDAPVAVDDVVTAVAGVASIASVLDNDSDVDGDLLTVQITAAPAHGAATVAGGSITYVAEAGYAGADQLTYSISDQGGLSATAIVAITVTPDETTGEEGKHIYLPLIQTLK